MNVSVVEAGWIRGITARFVALTFKSCNHVTPARSQSMRYKSMTAFSLHVSHLRPAHPCHVKINESAGSRVWATHSVNGGFSSPVDTGRLSLTSRTSWGHRMPPRTSCYCWPCMWRLSNDINRRRGTGSLQLRWSGCHSKAGWELLWWRKPEWGDFNWALPNLLIGCFSPADCQTQKGIPGLHFNEPLLSFCIATRASLQLAHWGALLRACCWSPSSN